MTAPKTTKIQGKARRDFFGPRSHRDVQRAGSPGLKKEGFPFDYDPERHWGEQKNGCLAGRAPGKRRRRGGRTFEPPFRRIENRCRCS